MRSQARRQRGNSMLEFALVCSFLVPLFAGAVQAGLLLSKNMQVANVNRDAVVLLVRSVTDPASGLDLSLAQNQALLLRAASGLGMNQSGTYTADSSGKGAIILSKVVHVSDLECARGVVPAPNGAPPWTSANCPNYDQYVFGYRVLIGNGGKYTSVFGTPPSAIVASNGIISDADIAQNTNNRASRLGSGGFLTLNQSTFALVAETFADVSAVNLFKIISVPTLYTRNFS